MDSYIRLGAMAGTLTWLGHAAFRIDTPGGKRVYVDPFLNGNPKCPEAELEPERVDLILLTHGHDDHVGDTVPLYGKLKPRVIAPVELRWLLESAGVPDAQGSDPNKGGTVDVDGIKVTITDANHSSSYGDQYTGEPTGLVVTLEDGFALYFAGDTNVFGDMALIRRLYEPKLAVLPIGDHYTMGPKEAAVALELLGVERCVPCHWGTFGLLTGTPEALRELAPAGVEIVDVEPGGSVEL
jgi:L-ascorbate metabolism protein UlaG (beta-lactamase superfamily)